MLNELKAREREGNPIEVGLVGCGSMGCAIAWQIARTPGMRLSFVADRDPDAASQAQKAYGRDTIVADDAARLLGDPRIPCDVFVEATNSIVAAYDYCSAAIDRGAHCVLMNAEVDLILGGLLRTQAAGTGVVVTSDAGDQHGVLARMMEEIELWGFEIVQAGNMKGFLDRHRDFEGTIEVARSLRLSTVQCLAYTDGSKLNIEMAVVANQYGLTPLVPGMEGPRADRVEQVLDLFDFDRYERRGRVDYILGAKQFGSGVYVVARCDDPMQQFYLDYYKVNHRHPYYLFFRPYHLCHVETPRAIALAALYRKAVCTQRAGRVADCYAYAKKRLVPGTRIVHAIGSDEVYGMIDATATADREAHVPQGLLHCEQSALRPVLRRALERDQPVTHADVDLPDTRMLELWERQKGLRRQDASPTAHQPEQRARVAESTLST